MRISESQECQSDCLIVVCHVSWLMAKKVNGMIGTHSKCSRSWGAVVNLSSKVYDEDSNVF